MAQMVRRRIWVVLVCFVLAVTGSVIWTLKAEKQYSATSALLLRPSAAVEPQRVMETNLQLTSLPQLAALTAKEVGGMSATEVEEAVEASQQGESDIIQIEATSTDPRKAAKIANVFAEQFISFRKDASRGDGDLESTVQLVERAQAEDTPISPKPARNVAFGALIGLMLGVGMALLLEQLDRRVKRQDDILEVTGIPLLATIPKRDAFNYLGDGTLSPAEAEVFLKLRANLRYFNVRKEIRSVLVVSAQSGEGKTTVSIGLGLGAAMSGERVLLIEADMRDPSIAAALDAGPSSGLSWLLATPGADLGSAIATVDVRRLAPFAGAATMDVLPAGPVPPNPTELVESSRMRELLAQAEEAYDFVVIDTPPMMAVADVVPMVSAVSGVVVVSGIGVSTRGVANDLAELLERLEAPTLGLAANFATGRERDLKGYGYGRPPEAGIFHPGA